MHESRNKRAALIINARSGAANNHAVAQQVAMMLDAHGIAATITVGDGVDVRHAAQQAVRSSVQLAIAGGGDGTINTVASALVGTDTALGVLPLGTLNHFAKDLQIPSNVADAATVAIEGRERRVDVGDVNGRPFLNNASIGVYARMVWERERERRSGRSRWTALGLALGRVWQHYRRVRVRIRTADHERIVRTPFVVIANNEYVLDGTQLGARLRLDAGRLQVSMAPDMTRYELVRMLFEAFTGRLHGEQHLETLTVDTLEIDARRHRLGVSLDGELSIIETPLHFRSRPQALRVMVPA